MKYLFRLSFALALYCAGTCVRAQDPILSTARDTKVTSLSVYNDGFAIVREQRTIKLAQGLNTIRYEDVAEKIDPRTISIKSQSFANSLNVKEQNYQYDLLSPGSILSKSTGKSLSFRRILSNGQIETLQGTLLNAPQSSLASDGYRLAQDATDANIVLRTSDGKVVLNPLGEITLNDLPPGLVSRPSLFWNVNCSHAGEHLTEVAYMTSGIEWKADYVAVIDASDRSVDLNAWVTIENKSGNTYNNAELQLVAGSVRRVNDDDDESNPYGAPARPKLMMAKTESAFKEESFFEYHLYTLDGQTTVANNEIKQIQLMSAQDITVEKRLIFDPIRYYSAKHRPGDGSVTEECNAAVIVDLRNSKKNNLGIPLPKGVLHMYKADTQGRLQFVGEDRIEHTSSDETMHLYLGDAFDVVGTRSQKDTKQISKRVAETSYEITVRNHKKTSCDLSVVEHLYGDWDITTSTSTATKVDAQTAEFRLNLAADETKTISFTVRTKW